MRRLNWLIGQYTHLVRQHELQLAYRGILEYLGKLRAAFMKDYPEFDVSNIYQGYMDMSYFSVSTKFMKDKGLKVALVYEHEKGHFEVWLSARNREISKRLESEFAVLNLNGIAVFHDAGNQDAIIECTLVSEPDFDDQVVLTDTICQGTKAFIDAICELLAA